MGGWFDALPPFTFALVRSDPVPGWLRCCARRPVAAGELHRDGSGTAARRTPQADAPFEGDRQDPETRRRGEARGSGKGHGGSGQGAPEGSEHFGCCRRRGTAAGVHVLRRQERPHGRQPALSCLGPLLPPARKNVQRQPPVPTQGIRRDRDLQRGLLVFARRQVRRSAQEPQGIDRTRVHRRGKHGERQRLRAAPQEREAQGEIRRAARADEKESGTEGASADTHIAFLGAFQADRAKRMELDFRKSPEVLAKIVDITATGIFTVDAKGRFLSWNRAAERITGYSEDEVVGKPCTLLEGANCTGFGGIQELLRHPEPGDGICEQQCKVLAKDGREVFLHGNVCLVRDDAGQVAGAVGAFLDMTPMVQANEKLQVLTALGAHDEPFLDMVGQSQRMREVFRRLQLAADSDVTVLLTGESGTGKELAARAIHTLSARRDQPMISINCSAIP
ncbi:MAG TPA: PAS domain S-box protein, partial [Planctomycetaceae bacterium]|nr:PAS domain S-box protein [Planctomycetaceae bacterium]